MKTTTNDGQIFLAERRIWRIFAPGWRLWRWAGWLWRRARGVPRCTRTIRLPEGERRVRGEQVGQALQAAPKLARQAPLGGKRAS